MVAARLDFMFASYLTAAPFVESGKLRCWRLPGRSAIRTFRKCRTMGEAGYPRSRWRSGSACSTGRTAGTDRRQAHAEFVKALNSEEVQKILLPQVVVIPGPPEDLPRWSGATSCGSASW